MNIKSINHNTPYPPQLQWHERQYYRDQLRAARYAALADAEGFHTVCFALEALGMRVLGKKADLGKYQAKLEELSKHSIVLSDLSVSHTARFSKFAVLFDCVRSARNDAMHTGVYARHATTAAIELCIGLEEALMRKPKRPDRQLAKDFMVKSPVIIDHWQPVAHARQIMLTHSFSFLPVCIEQTWKLISEGAMARYLRSGGDWKILLSKTIEDAASNGLALHDAHVINLDNDVNKLIMEDQDTYAPRLWLVKDETNRICGVLSPFELM